MKIKEIAFLGDSFTWGEGLDLYLDSPFWVNQRKKRSLWADLVKIQTPESILFREKNRFSGTVSKYFSSNCIIDSYNGGCLNNITKYLYNFIQNKRVPEYIIIQFSCFNRNPIHYHLGSLFGECECGKCNQHQPTIHSFFHFLDTIRKKYVNNEKLDDQYEFYLNWLIDEFGFQLPEFKNNKDAFTFSFEYVNSIIDSYSYLHLNHLLNEYVLPLENMGSVVYFIDSWDTESSKILHDVSYIKKNMISLQKYNSVEFTKSYNEFENSFQYTRINCEFTRTENQHPTLLQHEYIAKSIINEIEKNYKNRVIKLI